MLVLQDLVDEDGVPGTEADGHRPAAAGGDGFLRHGRGLEEAAVFGVLGAIDRTKDLGFT